jgi:hypothetical protein
MFLMAMSGHVERGPADKVVDSGIPGIVDLQKGPDGSLYGADVYDGTIRRWVDPSATFASALGLVAGS